MECREAMAAEVLGAAVYAPFRPAPTVLTSGGWGLPSGGGGGGPPVGEVPPEEDADPDCCDRSPACLDDLVGTAMVGPAAGGSVALSVFLPVSYQRENIRVSLVNFGEGSSLAPSTQLNAGNVRSSS